MKKLLKYLPSEHVEIYTLLRRYFEEDMLCYFIVSYLAIIPENKLIWETEPLSKLENMEESTELEIKRCVKIIKFSKTLQEKHRVEKLRKVFHTILNCKVFLGGASIGSVLFLYA